MREDSLFGKKELSETSDFSDRRTLVGQLSTLARKHTITGAHRHSSKLVFDCEDMAAEVVLRHVQEIAQGLAGVVRKYPMHGRGAINNPQERYFACVPAASSEITTGDAAAGDNTNRLLMELKMWKKGKLAYWVDEKAYTDGKAEKGHVLLSRIAKVYWDKAVRSGCIVNVKHKQNNEFLEMSLRFATKSEAEQWNHDFHEFLAILNEVCHLMP